MGGAAGGVIKTVRKEEDERERGRGKGTRTSIRDTGNAIVSLSAAAIGRFYARYAACLPFPSAKTVDKGKARWRWAARALVAISRDICHSSFDSCVRRSCSVSLRLFWSASGAATQTRSRRARSPTWGVSCPVLSCHVDDVVSSRVLLCRDIGRTTERPTDRSNERTNASVASCVAGAEALVLKRRHPDLLLQSVSVSDCLPDYCPVSFFVFFHFLLRCPTV